MKVLQLIQNKSLKNKGDFIANYILRRIRESTILDLSCFLQAIQSKY